MRCVICIAYHVGHKHGPWARNWGLLEHTWICTSLYHLQIHPFVVHCDVRATNCQNYVNQLAKVAHGRGGSCFLMSTVETKINIENTNNSKCIPIPHCHNSTRPYLKSSFECAIIMNPIPKDDPGKLTPKSFSLSILMFFFQLCGLFLILASIPAAEGLPCLPGVERFASRSGLDFYYYCEQPGEQAVEVQCPHGQLFSRKGSRCIASKTRGSSPINWGWGWVVWGPIFLFFYWLRIWEIWNPNGWLWNLYLSSHKVRVDKSLWPLIGKWHPTGTSSWPLGKTRWTSFQNWVFWDVDNCDQGSVQINIELSEGT